MPLHPIQNDNYLDPLELSPHPRSHSEPGPLPQINVQPDSNTIPYDWKMDDVNATRSPREAPPRNRSRSPSLERMPVKKLPLPLDFSSSMQSRSSSPATSSHEDRDLDRLEPLPNILRPGSCRNRSNSEPLIIPQSPLNFFLSS